MTHPLVRKPEDAPLFWNDELEPHYGKADIIDTADKASFGKRGKHRHAHKMEDSLPRFQEKSKQKYSEGKKPALVLDFAKTGEDSFSTVVDGVFITVKKRTSSKKWDAQASFRAWKTPVFEADDPASALTRLVHFNRWFCHRNSMEWWSLGKLYSKVHFVLPFGKRKRMPAAGTFDRTFMACQHVDGWFAWKPAPARTPLPAQPKKQVKTTPIPAKTKVWTAKLDDKYMVVGGVLTLKAHWDDADEYVGRI